MLFRITKTGVPPDLLFGGWAAAIVVQGVSFGFGWAVRVVREGGWSVERVF